MRVSLLMPNIAPLEQLDAGRFETPSILKKLASSSRALAELKGIAASIPNQGILINMLALQLLNPGGILLSFSCSGLMPTDLFQKILADAAVDAGRDVQFIEQYRQAADHPVIATYPEGLYLKGFACRVM